DGYRVRPGPGLGLGRHRPGRRTPAALCPAASICPPVLTRGHAVYGGLDGKLYVVPLAGGEAWSFATAFAAPITAPVAVSGGRIYMACEDGYLYVLGADGKAPLPKKDLDIARIRSPIA